MISLSLAVGLWCFSIAAPLGGAAEPVAAYQTYQVIESESGKVESKYHPPIYVEVGVLTNYGNCVPPCRSKRVLGDDGWGNWQWRCIGRHGAWQICGVQ